MASSAALLGGHLATFARLPPRRQPRRRSRPVAPAPFLGLGGKAARGGDASNATSGVTLWGSPGSRSPLVDWYLHELDVPFDAKSPGDPNNPHPFGQIPALRDGEVEVALRVDARPDVAVDEVVVYANCDEVARLPTTDPGAVIKLDTTLRLLARVMAAPLDMDGNPFRLCDIPPRQPCPSRLCPSHQMLCRWRERFHRR